MINLVNSALSWVNKSREFFVQNETFLRIVEIGNRTLGTYERAVARVEPLLADIVRLVEPTCL